MEMIMNEATTFEPMTWALTHGEYIATIEKIAKINDRAVKRGFTGRLVVEGTREERTEVDTLTGLDITHVFYNTRVTGTAPSYGGFTFLARIDRVGDSFTIANAPGVEHVERSLVHPGECDHCGMNRQRNNTYLVRNDETGETVNVGSTCIKDFLGWDASVTFFAEGDVEPVEQGGAYYAPQYSVDTILAFSIAAIRAHGWVARSSYTGQPTADLVLMVLSGRRLTEREAEIARALRAHAPEAEALAAEVKAFILSDDFNGTSTYVDNLKVIAAQDAVTGREVGLLASAPQAYTRHLGQAAERKAKAAKTEGSDFVGAVGDKIEVKGSIEAVNFIDGAYGTTTLYTILGEDGNLYKWFSTNGALGEDKGVQVHIKGTIKSHDEYRGVKSTVLTRCKSLVTSDVKTDGYGNRVI
jgi:hypothetical protein